MSYFARYMDTYLSLSERCQTPVTPVTGALAGALTGADNENVVAVKKWHRTKNTVAMYLSNGALQVPRCRVKVRFRLGSGLGLVKGRIKVKEV